MEICSDSSFLNCWEFYFNEQGVDGFFKLDCYGKPNFEKGFFMISNPLHYFEMHELYQKYAHSRDSLYFINNANNLNLEMYYRKLENQINLFKADSNSIYSCYNYDEFSKPLRKKRIQKRILEEVYKMHIGASTMNSYNGLGSTMHFYKNNLEVEYFTTNIVVVRKLFTPNLWSNTIICEINIPINIVLSIRYLPTR